MFKNISNGGCKYILGTEKINPNNLFLIFSLILSTTIRSIDLTINQIFCKIYYEFMCRISYRSPNGSDTSTLRYLENISRHYI